MVGPPNDNEMITTNYQSPKISVGLLSINLHILLIRSNGIRRRRKVTLVEHPQLIRLKSAHNRVKQPPIMENDQITFFPILGVDQPGGDARSLDLVEDLTDSLKIVNDTTFGIKTGTFGRGYVKLVGAARVNLYV